ncbi:carbamoyltransferase HypF, partial [Acidithiobacillus caldus]|uniref:Kae1-like domain-containing protein n=2 Tax=Acidithiobacillus caldus TaxID=33059 RepID=UPI001C06ED9E
PPAAPFCPVYHRLFQQLPKEAPIVLLKRREPLSLPDSVAPGMCRLGFMLPYTPLHHLLLRRWERPIVLTSGNLTDAPQITDEVEAIEALDGIADWILSHDRTIVNRVDDSVAVVAAGELRLLRRARGYAPAPLSLPEGFSGLPQILALGSELKNTFCLIKDDQAILSQHMGDLADVRVWEEYQIQLARYRDLFAHEPERIAIDAHPGYHASQLGQKISEELGLPLDQIQHHHAHAAAVLGERAIPIDHPLILTVALDGLGYGLDGALWGGELFLANYHRCQRIGRLLPSALLGGEQAMREPWRNTLAQIFLSIGLKNFIEEFPDLAITDWLKKQPLAVYEHMWRQGTRAPSCSSMGRLFDAVAAACSLAPERLSFEGQAAMLLEAAIAPGMIEKIDDGAYLLPVVTDGGLLGLDPRPLWQPLLSDLRRGLELSEISARFHVGLARSLYSWIEEGFQRANPDSRKIVLCGGVFQNVTLLELLQTQLQDSGFEVLASARLPANDGGLSFGQALVSAARALSDKRAQTERRTPSCV